MLRKKEILRVYNIKIINDIMYKSAKMKVKNVCVENERFNVRIDVR